MSRSSRCGTCTYWQKGGSPLSAASRNPIARDDYGTCQIGPPMTIDQPFAYGFWPETHASRFCSEWDEASDTDGETVVPFKPKPAA